MAIRVLQHVPSRPLVIRDVSLNESTFVLQSGVLDIDFAGNPQSSDWRADELSATVFDLRSLGFQDPALLSVHSTVTVAATGVSASALNSIFLEAVGSIQVGPDMSGVAQLPVINPVYGLKAPIGQPFAWKTSVASVETVDLGLGLKAEVACLGGVALTQLTYSLAAVVTSLAKQRIPHEKIR